MCCVFTCCGWVTDLFQRCWTFAMSCLISSAVCCAFLTAAMSGVALGYNYSLAEYIENKETNVSVYLKRGVFDDEVVNELDWRRGGGGIPAPEKLEQGLERSGAEENPPEQSQPTNQYYPERRGFDMTTIPDDDIVLSPTPGRRLDDSIIQSDDNHRFEGALLRFTGALANLATTINPYAHSDISSVTWNYEEGSSESLKDLQAQINAHRIKQFPAVISTPAYAQIHDPNYQPDLSKYDNMVMPQSGRRMLVPETPAPELSLRMAAPVIDKDVWRDPQPHPYIPNEGGFKEKKIFTPPPIPIKILGPIAEFKSKLSTQEPKSTKKLKARPQPPKLSTKAMPFVMDLEEELSTRGIADILKRMRGPPEEKDYDEEEVKGLPVRRRRNIKNPDIDSTRSKKPDSNKNILRTSEKESANNFSVVKDGFFDKLALAIVTNFKNLRASEQSKSEEHNVETTNESTTTFREQINSGEMPFEDIVTGTVNSFSVTPSTNTVLLKIIKSTIIS